MGFFSSNAKAILATTFLVVLLMSAAFATVFFIVLRGGEEVMVPQVEGRALIDALVEMQEKELYPRIQLRYSDNAADVGRVLEQEPKAGSIVKAGRRISIVVSRGAATEQVDNFTGQSIDNARAALQAFSAGDETPILSLMEPVLYRESAEPAGTILEQNPPPGTLITEPIQISFVVSSGLDNNLTVVPSIAGKSIDELLSIMQEAELVFNFTATAQEGEETGTVVSQLPQANTRAEKFSAVDAVIAMPPASEGGYVYGIFREELPRYQYPFQVTIDIIPPSGGRRREYLSMLHPGGSLSVPYALAEGSMISLTVLDREYGRYELEPAIPAAPPEEQAADEDAEQEEEYDIFSLDNFEDFDNFDSVF